jgi:hypothetical protein
MGGALGAIRGGVVGILGGPLGVIGSAIISGPARATITSAWECM